MPELCTNYTCLACRHAQPVSVPIRSDLAASKPLLPRENTANVSSLFIAQARKRFVCGFLYIGQYTVIREVRLFLFFFCCLGESRFLSAIQSPPIFSILQAYFRAHFCGEEEFTSFSASKKKTKKKNARLLHVHVNLRLVIILQKRNDRRGFACGKDMTGSLESSELTSRDMLKASSWQSYHEHL